ncbi:VolA/Pla-1 family phospholipase [Vibrio methylphosphonaticus]|uniref:VolA/Pla-1 family phospholipase n=1 Tax=Vibrio methylphosphonaticus TaxID=2946866 RepID=UPI00202A4B5E|nr:VolA/Pla-1 family phospholipase [Vibrio methylphosphonaticus]MCL9776626.1 lipase [Vibrio methylphosphonaticus]
MKPLYLASVISGALLLSACGGESELSGTPTATSYEQHIETLLSKPTKVVYTLQGANADVPFPTFALMNTMDGTLEIPTGGNDALSNPIAAMGQTDGWSTTSPIAIKFDKPLTSAPAATSVTMVKLTKGLTSDSPLPDKLLTYGVDYVVKTQGTTLIVIPLIDLAGSSEYIIAVNNTLLDANGDSVGTSQSYAALKSQTKIYSEGSLATAQQVVQGVEALIHAGSAGAVDPNSIVYSTWFSTQSIGATLYATKGMLAAAQDPSKSYSDIWKGSANPNNADVNRIGEMTFSTPVDLATALASDDNFTTYLGLSNDTRNTVIANYNSVAAGTVSVTKGTIKLPYYLETGDRWNTQPFESGTDSLAITKSIITDSAEQANFATQLQANNINPGTFLTDPESLLADLMGLSFTKLDGSVFDSERIVTRYSPVPAVKSLQDVNFLLYTPTSGTITGIAVYQHGITSAKENSYLFASNLVKAGQAVIAIDAPLHGDRSLPNGASAQRDVTDYMNLTVLPVARDNIRQSMLDIMTLRMALSTNQLIGGFTNTPLAALPSTIATPPTFIGHSLGGVLGIPAVTQANAPLNASVDPLFKFSRAAFVNSGGQIANLLLGSDSFGPLVTHNIALSAGIGYDTFVNSRACDQFAADPDTYFDSCLGAFKLESPIENTEKILTTNTEFSYAVQTVLDTADPYTHATTLKAIATPVYMAQVKGDGTVPNNVPGYIDQGQGVSKYVQQSIFAGTEPLAAKLGLTVVSSSQGGAAEMTPFVRFNAVGQHSSYISVQDTTTFSDLAHHQELQSEVSSFIATGTAAISNSASVLE